MVLLPFVGFGPPDGMWKSMPQAKNDRQSDLMAGRVTSGQTIQLAQRDVRSSSSQFGCQYNSGKSL
jgi:hypothetical protein